MTLHPVTFLRTTLPKSLIPLGLSGILFAFGWVFNQAGDDKGANVLLSFQELLLNTYNSYFGFMLMMLILDISFKLWPLSKSALLKTQKDYHESMILDLKNQRSYDLRGFVIFKKIMTAFIQYTLAYCLLQISGMLISTVFIGSRFQSLAVVETKSQETITTSPLLSLSPPQRILQEEEDNDEDEIKESPFPKSMMSTDDLDALSLSAGKILSSWNIDVESFVFSHNGTVAWVAIAFTGIIKSFNLTDLNFPAEMSTITTSKTSSTFSRRSMLLSRDEKTLFVSSFQTLDIIDISQLWEPVTLGQVQDGEAEEQDFFVIPDHWFYRISLALTGDEKHLFVAGIGLQIFDLNDLKVPILLNTTIQKRKNQRVRATSVEISLDKKTLFYANTTLHAFDLSEFRGPSSSLKHLFAYQGLEEISSIVLSKTDPRAYIAGIAGVRSKRRVVMRILNISEPARPRVIKTYDMPKVWNTTSPLIAHVAPQESHVFLLADTGSSHSDLQIFNLIKEELLDNSRSLLPKIKTLALTADSRYVIAGANNQLKIMKLNFIYPNTRAFGLSTKVMSRFPLKGMINGLVLSSNQKILFVSLGELSHPDESYFEIYNVSDPYSPELLSSYHLEKPSSNMGISESSKRAVFIGEEILLVLDISDLRKSKLLVPVKETDQRMITDFDLSADGNVAYVLDIQTASAQTYIYDFSNLANVKKIEPRIFPDISLEYPRILSSFGGRRLLFIATNLTIYDMTDLQNPKALSSIFVAIGEPSVRVVFASLSPDENLLAVVTYETGGFHKLRMFDVSDPTEPRHLSQTPVMKSMTVFGITDPIFSPDGKKLFLKQDNGLMVLNISDPYSPMIVAIMPVELKNEVISQFIMSKDNKIGFMVTNSSELRILDLELRYTMFLNQEQFTLGNKYSDGVKLFSLNNNKRFLPMENDEYRFTKTGLFKISLNPTEYAAKGVLSALPDWISFDKENSWITVDPKKESDLGTYTIYSAFSKKIPFEAFSGVRFADPNITTEDLVTALISLGYLDTELFLTPSFISLQTFFLPSEFALVKREIYEILKLYFIEACTTFDIFPSLSIGISKNKIFISSSSTNSIRVDLSFGHLKLYGEGCAHFLTKTYGTLQPIMLDKKSELILEGSLKEVNAALRQVVVDVDNSPNCFGSVNVIDNLNPMNTIVFRKMHEYFILNTAPAMTTNPNRTLQTQISQIPIKTGEYFTLTLHPRTFNDENADSLSYRLAMQDPALSLPTWLSLEGLVLKGTPPEDVLGRDIQLKLVAKNEYKESEAPFVLRVGLSPMFIFKLCLRFSPYLLTVVGLLIGTNKIYNVLAKDRYKHTKDYFIEIGKEVNSNVIFPVLMVKDEKREAQVIWKAFEKQVCGDLGKRSIEKRELARNFVNRESGDSVDKLKIVRTINKAVNTKMSEEDQEKIPIYLYGADSHKRWINQFIINELVKYQCEEDRTTLKVFDKLKEEWVELVNWDSDSSQFMINQERFNALVMKSENNAMNTSIITNDASLLGENELNGVNIGLLKDAIIAYAYECQTLEILAIEAQVFVKEKRLTGWFKSFLKFDLFDINLGNQFKVDYGIQCGFEDDCLVFSGKAHSNFKRKTLVIQIFNRRQRILKEVWIHEDSLRSPKRKILGDEEEVEEYVARGQSYAVF